MVEAPGSLLVFVCVVFVLCDGMMDTGKLLCCFGIRVASQKEGAGEEFLHMVRCVGVEIPGRFHVSRGDILGLVRSRMCISSEWSEIPVQVSY